MTARIAFCGNTVNTGYVCVRMLRRWGREVDLVADGESVPFNQRPFWEDADIALDPVVARSMRSRDWRKLEREAGWAPPEWIVQPALSTVPGAGTLSRAISGAAGTRGFVPFTTAVALAFSRQAGQLSRYEAACVLGPEAIAGWLSGRPFMVMTMGWDVRVLPFMSEDTHPLRRARARLQRRALAAARELLVLPSHDTPYLERLGLTERVRPFPIPVDVDAYAQIEGTGRAIFGEDVADRARDKLLVFCASRVDLDLKGHDRLIEGVALATASGVAVHLVLLGWGRHVERVRAQARALGIAEHVTLIPKVFGKVRLVRAMRSADVVADQFLLGAYGTLAREALACGRPLLASYDPALPQPHAADDPAPIVSARSAAEIAEALGVLSSRDRRAQLEREGAAWARRVHRDIAMDALDRHMASLLA